MEHAASPDTETRDEHDELKAHRSETPQRETALSLRERVALSVLLCPDRAEGD